MYHNVKCLDYKPSLLAAIALSKALNQSQKAKEPLYFWNKEIA
jgi:hypothetical protein